jgi:hypothetical protein
VEPVCEVKGKGDEDDEPDEEGSRGDHTGPGTCGSPARHECRMAMSERTLAASSHLSVALSRFW